MTGFLRIRILGFKGAGKSALFDRICSDTFSSSSADVSNKSARSHEYDILSDDVTITVWDPAPKGAVNDGYGNHPCGWEPATFQRSLTTHGFLICYDITNRESFDQLKPEIDALRLREVPNCGGAVFLILVGTKADLVTSVTREVSSEEGKVFAKENGMDFCEVSAATNHNVQILWNTLISDILDAHRRSGEVFWNKIGERATKEIGAPLPSSEEQKALDMKISKVGAAIAGVNACIKKRKEIKPGLFGNNSKGDLINRETDWAQLSRVFFQNNSKYWEPTPQLMKSLNESISTYGRGFSKKYSQALTVLRDALLISLPSQNTNNNNNNDNYRPSRPRGSY